MANGRVYIGTVEGLLLCLDLRHGQEIWRHRSIESTDPDDFAPGFMAPVTLSPTTVFAGDEDGVLHAVDRETGKPLWKFPTEGLIKGGATLLPDAGFVAMVANLNPLPLAFAQFQNDQDGKPSLLRLTFSDGQAYDLRRE